MKKIRRFFAALWEKFRLFLRRNQEKFDWVDGVFSSNPILINGMAIAPAVMATVNLQSALTISIGFFAIIVPTIMIMSFVYSHINEHLRSVVTSFVAALCFVGLTYGLHYFVPSISSLVGLYLPILVLDPIIFAKTEEFCELGTSKWRVLVESVFHALGFTLVVCLVGSLRELIAYGTILGHTIAPMLHQTSAALPFFGFFVLAILAAFVRYTTRKFYHWINKKGSDET